MTAMPPVTRSDLPAELAETFAIIESNVAWSRNYRPVLPANETPPELVATAIELDKQIAAHPDLPETKEILRRFSDYIDAAINKTLTEPTDLDWGRYLLNESNLDDYPYLSNTCSKFIQLVESEPSHGPFGESWKADLVFNKKAAAKNCGVELDLTDDEWANL